jgi:hypothetical protein
MFLAGTARFNSAQPKASTNNGFGGRSLAVNRQELFVDQCLLCERQPRGSILALLLSTSFRRGTLSGHVYSETKRKFPDLVDFHFESTLSSLQLSEGRAAFQQGDKLVECKYDLLVAADGARSK